MDIEKEFAIPLNRGRLALFASLSLLFVLFFGFLLAGSIGDSSSRSWILSILTSVFFLISLLVSIGFLAKFFDKSPGLIIGPSGIFDNATVLSAGMITWHNISNIHVQTIHINGTTTKVLTIEVMKAFGPQYYRNGNHIIRIIKRILNPSSKTEFPIPAGTLNIAYDQLANIIDQYYQKYGRA